MTFLIHQQELVTTPMGYWVFVAMRDVSVRALKKAWVKFAEHSEGQAMGGQGIIPGRNPLKDAA